MSNLMKFFSEAMNPPKAPDTSGMDVNQLMAYFRQPSANDKLMAISKALSGMGEARSRGGDFGQQMGMAGGAMGQSLQDARNQRLGEFEQSRALQSLMMPKLGTRRESWGKDAQGNPIKYHENVFEDGRVERIQGSEVPMYKPEDANDINFKNALNKLKILDTESKINYRNQKAGVVDVDTDDDKAPWRNVAGAEKERMKGRVFAAGQKKLEEIAKERAKSGTLATEGEAFMAAYNRQKPSVGVQKLLPDFVAGLDDELASMDAITSRLAPNMRPEGSGATSDFEMRGFLRGTLARDKPKQTNEDIAKSYKALNDREKERYAFFEQRLTEQGHLAGADAEWQEYINAEPLFTPEYGYNTKRKSFAEWVSGKAPIGGYDKPDRRAVAVPNGVDPELWADMTPAERAAWQ